MFGSASLVYGQDDEISEPLAQIRPFESTVGLRWHDPSEIRMWGADFGFRMVARQPRIARFRGVGVVTPDQFFTVPVESVTPGFCAGVPGGYYRVGRNLNVVGGIENLFDRAYLEHLDLRLPEDRRQQLRRNQSAGTRLFPFVGIEWVR